MEKPSRIPLFPLDVVLLPAMTLPLHIFEPRLRGIKVVPLEPVAGSPHVMRFQIDGLLEMDPAPEHISFDTTLQLSSGEYQVKGDSSAG